MRRTTTATAASCNTCCAACSTAEGRRLLDPQIVLIAGTTVLLGAVVQGTVGFGVGLVAAPVVTLLDPSLMPGSLLVVVFLLAVMSLVSEHQDLDPRVGWVFAGRFLGTIAGAGIVVALSREDLAIGIGVMTLLAVLLSVRSFAVPVNRWTLAGAGCVSGIGATTSSIGGPPLAFIYQRSDPATLRSTVALVFTAGSALSIGALSVAGEMTVRELLAGLAFIPFFTVGFALSHPWRKRLRGPRFRQAVLVVIAASAVVLLVRPFA
ncbi:MAG: TSUP family transporter [Propionibacteriales bacterium]|nr:TSUP family transporter [Propionibacteriales bacterium]